MNPDKPLLRIHNLKTYFYTYNGVVKAIDGMDLESRKQEVLGLVGETGCGKSVTVLSILRLIDPPGKIVEGELWFRGEDLLKKNEKEMRKIRGKHIAIVFQDPMTYLNPVLTVGEQISEVIKLHQDLSEVARELRIKVLKNELGKLHNLQPQAQKMEEEIVKLESSSEHHFSSKILRQVLERKVVDALKIVNMPDPERVVSRYPHELSGGMRQRVMLAMALSCEPELLIADEATTALDVTIQAQILELIKELKRKIRLSIIIITHNLGIVAEICDKVAIMYSGNIVEYANTEEIFKNPSHPYTTGLLRAIRSLNEGATRLKIIPGSVPDLINPPLGCRFWPRCKFAKEICKTKKPQTVEIEPGHNVACYLYSQGLEQN